MRFSCLSRATRSAGVILLIAGGSAVAQAGDLVWSLSTPPFEAGPRSFPALAVHLENQDAVPQTVHLHFDPGALRCVGPRELVATVAPQSSRTVLQTLYVPPEATGGSDAAISARDDRGTVHSTHVRIQALAKLKATPDPVDTRFLHPGEKAGYKVTLINIGNIPLHCAIKPKTLPDSATTSATPEQIIVPVGNTVEAMVNVAVAPGVTAFASLVTATEIQTAELTGDQARQTLYFHTEAFPHPGPADHTHLFETLKGSLLFGLGGGSGNAGRGRGADTVARETLSLEGLISENTRLQFLQSFTYPSSGHGETSSALSSLPGGGSRNFFHLGLYNPFYDLEAGEVAASPPRLLSTREIGDGARVVYRPTGKANLQVEAFAERNTLTVNEKDVFGTAVSGTVTNSPLEWWRVGSLSKRGDIGPQGTNWDTIGLDTGWKVPVTIPLRAEFSVAAGQNSVGRSGGAFLAGLHYNRTLPGETDQSPFKAGAEFASGDKGFPGQQNGRQDRRAYASFRFSASPTYVESYLTYSNSKFAVVPNVEKTLEEEQSLVPDFLLTSQSRSVTAGVRWKKLAQPTGAWSLPSGSLEYDDTSYFNKSDFFDRAQEHAVTLSLQPFEHPPAVPGGVDWQLTVVTRGGTENHENNAQATDSRFLTLGADLNYNRPAPASLNRLAGPGQISVEFSGRYTANLDDDSEALNRSGVSLTTSASWITDTLSARVGATLYSYSGEGVSDRLWASVTRRIGHDWWAGIEGAYTHRGNSSSSDTQGNDTALLLTFRHDFELAVPWLPRQGQVEGAVFNDLNNNGRQDAGEPGIEGVKVAVGGDQALSGKNGVFSLAPAKAGTYPVAVTPPADVHFNPSSAHPTTSTNLQKGAVTQLAIGLTKPTTCEGQVHFVREHSEADLIRESETDDLSGIEIVCTNAAGLTQRAATRADGLFDVYLDPGIYEISLSPDSLKPQQSVSPEKLVIRVQSHEVQKLAFTLTEHTKRIRKTFTAQKS